MVKVVVIVVMMVACGFQILHGKFCLPTLLTLHGPIAVTVTWPSHPCTVRRRIPRKYPVFRVQVAGIPTKRSLSIWSLFSELTRRLVISSRRQSPSLIPFRTFEYFYDFTLANKKLIKIITSNATIFFYWEFLECISLMLYTFIATSRSLW